MEVILINNGATEETREVLHEFESKDKRVRLLHFKENQYEPWDPLKMIDVCFNSALEMSTGDYVWSQEDDDLLAADYIEKMVNLFQGNSECTSAAGLTASIDAEGNLITGEKHGRKTNFRSRYMPGHILALEALRGSGAMYGNPGQIFSFKRDVLLKYGGFHRSYSYHQLYGIVPFGITGFDETAYFYWRRHEGQLNTELTQQGWFGTKEMFSLANDLNLEDKWRVYGNDTAKYVVKKIKDDQSKTVAYWFALHFFDLRIKASIKIVREIWFYPKFWLYLSKEMIQPKGFLKLGYYIVKPLLRPLLNCIDQGFPELKNRSTYFNKLIKHL